MRLRKNDHSIIYTQVLPLFVGFCKVGVQVKLISFLRYSEWQMCSRWQVVTDRDNGSKAVGSHKGEDLSLVGNFKVFGGVHDNFYLPINAEYIHTSFSWERM